MSGAIQQLSDSEELLYIYVILTKLKCIQTKANDQKIVPLNSSLFPKRFLLRQLNERLMGLDGLANEICNDLFRQVSGQPAKSTGSGGLHNQLPIDIQSESIRYPEFDEYFHFCIHQLYDFMIGIRWHEIDIEQLSKTDSDYVSKNLEFVGYLFAFQRTLVDMVKLSQFRSPARILSSSSNAKSLTSPGGKKSNLRGSPARRSSPDARRRVRFKDLPSEGSPVPSGRHRPHVEQSDLADNHSVLALDLLIYATNIYIQRLADTLVVWSNEAQGDLNALIDMIFDAKVRVRANQLQVIAKKIKIYNDVHLTVLDHLSEIKRTYLIKHIRGTLLSKDSAKLLHTYKNPRLKVYIQRIGLDVEAKILARLVKECLQIFFNLIVCEINFDSIENYKSRATKADRNKSQENIVNFMANWLKVDDVLFGYNMIRASANPVTQELEPLNADTLLRKIKHPQLVAKTSTLSLNGAYGSSSRILAQMDNLAEFMREFLDMIVGRLRYQQQVRYFLEATSAGLVQFFDIVAPKLEQQLIETQTRERRTPPKTPPPVAPSVNLLTVKIRCLKFIHVIGLADRIVANEATRMKVELGSDMDMDLKLARLTQLCINPKLKR